LEAGKTSLDPKTELLATLTSNLAMACMDLADCNRARGLLEEAIPGQEKGGPKCERALALLLANLGALELASERPQDACAPLQRALEIAARTPNAKADEASIASNLAVAHRMLGDLPAATEFLRRALDIQQRLLPSDHPSIATTYQNLSNLERALGRLPEARKYLLAAQAIDDRRLSPDHPERAVRLFNLGVLEDDMGDVQSAFLHVAAALAILERTWEPNDRRLAEMLGTLAGFEGQLGQLDSAKDHVLRAIAIQSATLRSSPQVSSSRWASATLARLYFKLGQVETAREDWAAARKALSEAIEIQERETPDDPSLLLGYQMLVNAHVRLGRLADAAAAGERIVSILERFVAQSGSPGMNQLIQALLWLSDIRAELGDEASARDLRRRADSVAEAALQAID
jgi:tetratricopeptide (TPR) repeat protein